MAALVVGLWLAPVGCADSEAVVMSFEVSVEAKEGGATAAARAPLVHAETAARDIARAADALGSGITAAALDQALFNLMPAESSGLHPDGGQIREIRLDLDTDSAFLPVRVAKVKQPGSLVDLPLGVEVEEAELSPLLDHIIRGEVELVVAIDPQVSTPMVVAGRIDLTFRFYGP